MVRGLGSIWKTHSERRKEDFQLEGAEDPSGPRVGIPGHLSELWSPGPCPRYGLGEFCFNSFLKGQDAGVSQTHICFSPTASDAGELEGGEGGICRGWEAGPPYSGHFLDRTQTQPPVEPCALPGPAEEPHP